MKYTVLSLALLLTSSFVFGQKNTAKRPTEDQIITLIDQLYTVEEFGQRFGNMLDNNPLFLQHADDEEFTDLLTNIAKETALDVYATKIRKALYENFTYSEMESLIEMFQSPYGQSAKQLFALDNTIIEDALGYYVNELLDEVIYQQNLIDSTRFFTEYPEDLSAAMIGSFTNKITNDLVVEIEREENQQTETVLDETYHFDVVWINNSKYYLINTDKMILGPDTIAINIYEVTGNEYKYVVRYNNGDFHRSTLQRSQPLNPTEEIFAFRHELNEQYAADTGSPLNEALRARFMEIGPHPFYPIDLAYRIEADLEVYKEPELIQFKTSTSRMAEYMIYGKATFELNGQATELFIYQPKQRSPDPRYKDHLFLPFRDLTSGETTYGGGRYVDLQIPEDPTKIVIDFNKAYHPYCAYTTGYSCPIPPAENFIDQEVKAGIQLLELE